MLSARAGFGHPTIPALHFDLPALLPMVKAPNELHRNRMLRIEGSNCARACHIVEAAAKACFPVEVKVQVGTKWTCPISR